jgi:formylmethanofuran dehydrogenase subunit E
MLTKETTAVIDTKVSEMFICSQCGKMVPEKDYDFLKWLCKDCINKGVSDESRTSN